MKIFPKIVQLCLHYHCQCHCRHCGVANLAHNIKGELSLSEIKKIFKDLKMSGTDFVDLSGGEPTLHKDLMGIIRLGKECGFEMSIETNGMNLDEEFISNLKKSGLDLMYLSLDDYGLAPQNRNRRGRGAFASAVDTLRRSHKMGLPVHVSIVPVNQEFFTDGEVNDQIDFCLKNGAEKIRILFPSHVGNCRPSKQTLYSEEHELSLLGHVDNKYHDLVYVEGPAAQLSVILAEREFHCPARRGFCYIAPNGYVMPCPYLPIVFGDIKRESMTEIFSRMYEHPFLKEGDSYCPTRDEEYLKATLADINEDFPFKFAKNSNRVNCFSSCNNNCHLCPLPERQLSDRQLMEKIAKVDRRYRTIHLYGGEIFTRRNALAIMREAAKDFEIVLYTNARVFANRTLAQKSSAFNIKAVKVPFFSFHKEKFEKMTGVEGSFRETLSGVANLAREGLAVSIYVPEAELESRKIESLISLGVVSVSAYKMGRMNVLPDSVLCFGNCLQETRLLWQKT